MRDRTAWLPFEWVRPLIRSGDALFRINVVRIALGLVLSIRYTTNAIDVLRLASGRSEAVAIGFELAAAVALTVGLLTPLATLSLLLAQWQADQTLRSWSLASVVLQMALFALTWLPAGTRLSL